MGTVITFANMKGGVGKTSSAIEVAYRLSVKDNLVLMIDLDAQCNLTNSIGEGSKKYKTIFDCINGVSTFAESIINIKENLDLLPGSRKMLSQYFVGDEDIYILKAALKYIYEYKNYDYIIIDVGPEPGKLMTMAMLASNYITAVTSLAKLAYDGVVQLCADMRTNNKIYKEFNAKPLGILITGARATNVSKENRKKYYNLAEEFGAMPFKTEIRNSCLMDECKEFNMSVQEYSPKSPIAKDYIKLVNEIQERIF